MLNIRPTCSVIVMIAFTTCLASSEGAMKPSVKRQRMPNTFLRYADPTTSRVMTFCACAKCGSTSLLSALHLSVSGEHIPDGGLRAPKSKPVHAWSWRRWGVAGVTPTLRPEGVAVRVVRDPFDRYVSAFFSKVRCCPDRLPPTRCSDDMGDLPRLVPDLLRLAGNVSASDRKCLHMAEYASALTAAHARGVAAQLDEHIRPQQYACPPRLFRRSTNALVIDELEGTAQAIAPLLHNLTGFAFKGGAIRVLHLHKSRRRTQAIAELMAPGVHDQLCRLALPESVALGLPIAANCLRACRHKMSMISSADLALPESKNK
jgi:hypothetical protein